MKKLLIVLFLVIMSTAAFTQKVTPVTIEGKWIAALYQDTIRLSFLDAAYGMIQWKTWSKTKSAFIYTMIGRGTNVLLTIKPSDNTRQDSLMFVLIKSTDKEYKLKNIVRSFSDGRRPELELSDKASYVLRKEDD